MGFTIALLIIVVFYVYQLYRSTAKQIELLEQNSEQLKSRITRLEKCEDSDQNSLGGGVDEEMKTELAKLKKKIAFHRAEVEGLEILVKAYKEEDQEDKLCLIEVMKKICRFLGFEHGADEVVEVAEASDIEDEYPIGLKEEGKIGLQDIIKTIHN